MQKIKLIALDLDGTTLNSKSQLTIRTKEVLEKAIAQGVHVVLASGRAFETFPADVMKLQGLSYAISSNGAATYDPVTRKRVFSFSMEPEKVDALYKLLLEEPELELEAFYQGIPYVADRFYDNPTAFGIPEQNVPYVQRTRRTVKNSRDFLLEHRTNLDSVDLICADPIIKSRWTQKLQKLGGVYLTSSMYFRLEISDEKSGKGAALKKIAELLKISAEEIVAFGNAENDMDMMAFAGLGVAVANSPEIVKEHADKVTLSNDEDGVAIVLEELLGI